MRDGEVVAARFEVLGRAGSGGMAEVYRARDNKSGELVALKLLHRHATPEVARFEREAMLLGQLEHPGIVRYVAQGVAGDGRPFLAMEWLDGESLSERLRRGPLGVAETLEVGRQVAAALAVPHRRGIVHRDLKPSNLLLVDGRVDRVKLIDFGVAGVRNAARSLTATGVMIGSPGYMSPEQVRGEHVDPRADVFALGCVLYKCVTGHAPYDGEVLAILAKIVADPTPSIRDVFEAAPEALSDLVLRMMAKDPAARQRDGAEVLEELEQLGELQTSQGRQRPSGGLTRAERRLVCLLLVRMPDTPGTLEVVVEPRDEDVITIIDGPPSDASLVGATSAPAQRGLRVALARHGGTVDTLADGSLLITVTPSQSATDQLERAARCALAVREVFEGSLLEGTPMALVAGRDVSSTGTAVGGLIDRAHELTRKLEHTAREPLDTSVAPADGAPIRLDDVTAGLLDAKFELGGDDAGLFLIGERDIIGGARTLLGKPVPCVGRERVLSSLEDVLYECISEPVARPVLITADAGVGKTRVLTEMLASLRLADEPIEIWRGNGDPMGSSSAFGMLTRLLRREAALRDGEPRALSRRKLAARLSRFINPSDHARVCDFIGELVGVPFDDGANVQLLEARNDPMLMSDQIQRAWLDLVAAECQNQPLLIALEDLHWGDLPSVELIDAALRELSDRPLMVVATARPEVREVYPMLWDKRDLTEIRLPPLTKRSSATLVHAALGSEVSRHTVSQIVDRAAGNAFYLEELIRNASEGRADELPASVLAMAQERLQHVDAEARRVLRAASVFGHAFSAAGAFELLGETTSRRRLDDWLDALVAEELISRRDKSFVSGAETQRHDDLASYEFRHALVREAAYAMLTDHDRRLGHRLAAAWLHAQGERDAVVLASHHERGGEPERAIGYYERAAGEALDGHDVEAALRHTQAAIDHGSTGEQLGRLHLLAARAHYWDGDFGGVQRASLAATALLVPGTAEWSYAMRNAVQSSGKLGQPERVEAFADELLATSPTPTTSEHPRRAQRALDAYLGALAVSVIELLFSGRRARIKSLLAHIDRGERRVADSILDQSAPTVDMGPLEGAEDNLRVKDRRPGVTAAIHAARAFDRLYSGDLGGYLHHTVQAVVRFEQAGDQRVATLYRINVAYALIEIGAYERAKETLEQAMTTATRMGLARLIALGQNNLGVVHLHLGQLDEARKVQTLAVEAYVRSGNKRMEGGSRRNLAAVLTEMGDLDAAEQQARAAIEVLEGAPPLRAHALATLARIASRRGDQAGARKLIEQARAIADDMGDIEEGEALIRLVFAQVLRAEGDIEGARAAIAHARERLLARAQWLIEPDQRASFLERVPDNAETFALHDMLAAGEKPRRD